jgi:hypothetical protein
MASSSQVLLSSYQLVVLSRLHQNHLLILPQWDACDSLVAVRLERTFQVSSISCQICRGCPKRAAVAPARTPI